MPSQSPPLLIETHQLASYQQNDNVLIIDLCDKKTYTTGHIQHAIHLEYSALIRSEPPVMGLLPTDTALSQTFSQIGLTQAHHVIAYDNEGNGKAARLLWTLATLGHTRCSVLNGGWQAWQAEQRQLSTATPETHHSTFKATDKNTSIIADKTYIKNNLQTADIILLDARSTNEYTGIDKRANLGGHIPGAINFDWLNGIDAQNFFRLKPKTMLSSQLQALSISPDKEIIVYCQTHHRSALSYLMLKVLGYSNVRGYPGSWSEWGNQLDLPFET